MSWAPLGHELIHIRVGPHGDLVQLDKTLLSTYPGFDSWLRSGIFNRGANIRMFPEEHSESFFMLVNWFTSGHLPPLKEADELHNQALLLIALYRLAATFGITKLENRIVSSYVRTANSLRSFPTPGIVKEIYEKIPTTWGLRKFASHVLYYVLEAGPEQGDYRSSGVTWSTEDIVELLEMRDLRTDLILLMRRKEQGHIVLNPLKEIPLCVYHNHALEIRETCRDFRKTGSSEDYYRLNS
ncbi:hypothetical protein B0O99DRAFT_594908 [Bisporella sp. PMI_857]|nr:hypothetical protein B0O99DRAFT_594908 [Bisporella sp. PMI_857]